MVINEEKAKKWFLMHAFKDLFSSYGSNPIFKITEKQLNDLSDALWDDFYKCMKSNSDIKMSEWYKKWKDT